MACLRPGIYCGESGDSVAEPRASPPSRKLLVIKHPGSRSFSGLSELQVPPHPGPLFLLGLVAFHSNSIPSFPYSQNQRTWVAPFWTKRD